MIVMESERIDDYRIYRRRHARSNDKIRFVDYVPVLKFAVESSGKCK